MLLGEYICVRAGRATDLQRTRQEQQVVWLTALGVPCHTCQKGVWQACDTAVAELSVVLVFDATTGILHNPPSSAP